MNLLEAYTKDKELKTKFLDAIDKQTQIDPVAIGKSDRCELGSWLHGEAERKYKFLKSYKPCLDAHAVFHTQANKVVRQINGREYEDAKALLADGTPFAKSLIDLGVALVTLKKDAKL